MSRPPIKGEVSSVEKVPLNLGEVESFLEGYGRRSHCYNEKKKTKNPLARFPVYKDATWPFIARKEGEGVSVGEDAARALRVASARGHPLPLFSPSFLPSFSHLPSTLLHPFPLIH